CRSPHSGRNGRRDEPDPAHRDLARRPHPRRTPQGFGGGGGKPDAGEDFGARGRIGQRGCEQKRREPPEPSGGSFATGDRQWGGGNLPKLPHRMPRMAATFALGSLILMPCSSTPLRRL